MNRATRQLEFVIFSYSRCHFWRWSIVGSEKETQDMKYVLLIASR